MSPLSGSENHRNKLQGMMSDFPSKPAKPPSVSAQSRSGEGKTSSPTVLQTCIPDLPAITSKFSLMKLRRGKVVSVPINIISGTRCGSNKTGEVAQSWIFFSTGLDFFWCCDILSGCLNNSCVSFPDVQVAP